MGSRNTFLVLCFLMILLMTSVFAQPRIAGGQRAHLGQFKFAVALEIRTVIDAKNATQSVCSGSLLSEGWVLSAAHCLHQYIVITEIMELKNLARTLVLAGDLDSENAFTSQTTTGQMRLSIKNYTHPDAYNLHDIKTFAKRIPDKTFQNLYIKLAPFLYSGLDIVLFKLQSPFLFGSNIGSIKLAKYYNSINNQLDCVAIGFGPKNSSHESKPDLNYIPVTIGRKDYCKIVKPGMPINENYHICVRGKKEFMNPCIEDSGGPLTCGEDGQEQVLYGVTGVVAISDLYFCGKSKINTGRFIFPNYAADWIANITGLVDFQEPTSAAATAPVAPASCGPFLAFEAKLFALVVFKSSWNIINY